ncbi:ABC-three component system middle component 7 [Pectobacterium brasiliense]|uniref:ABC-three component system middle component 7 n=1 Tax=Pectobacterium brasiliense TaxID=180957 RepID=UPI002A8281A5|nr:ABC-three component system middle component 7 [Pectobacterium brasiliense]MDY4382571.1 ABC-three component system middle component 7 [Pectobacterium brasiliense]
MIVPNKSIPLKDSIIYKMLVVLEEEFDIIDLIDLHDKVSTSFSNLDEFVYSLDVLFILDKIELIEGGRIKKC